MPNSIVKSFAKKSGKSVSDIEDLWKKAIKIASKKTSQANDLYAFTVGLLKKWLKISKTEGLLDYPEILLSEYFDEEGNFNENKWRMRAEPKADASHIFKPDTVKVMRNKRDAEKRKKRLQAQRKEEDIKFLLNGADLIERSQQYLDFLERLGYIPNLLLESDGIDKKLLKVIKNYDFWREVEEEWSLSGDPKDNAIKIKCAYSEDGGYIGEPDIAKHLVDKYKISKFEKASPKHNVVSIGFSEENQKWYGWSHRAIVGFGIGDKIFEEDFGDDETLFTQHGSKEIKTLDDAKQSAKNFASYVS